MRLLAVVVLLVTVSAFAGCAGKSVAYPEKYLLKADELPSGLTLSPIPEGLPISGNPGQVPASLLANLGPEFQGFAPDQVWVEFVHKSSDSPDQVTGGLMIASGFWNDGRKVDDAVSQIKSNEQAALCSKQDQGRALRDGNVVVLIGGDETMSSFVTPLASALQAKAPGLRNLC